MNQTVQGKAHREVQPGPALSVGLGQVRIGALEGSVDPSCDSHISSGSAKSVAAVSFNESNLSPRGGSFPNMAKQTAAARVNKSSRCPNCGEQQLVPIVYGYPGDFLMQLSLQGTVELGGCIVSADDPSFRCRHCHHDVWRDGRTHEPDA